MFPGVCSRALERAANNNPLVVAGARKDQKPSKSAGEPPGARRACEEVKAGAEKASPGVCPAAC